jgi:2-methylisocitrate lyase-like PEP mutase family enzyme
MTQAQQMTQAQKASRLLELHHGDSPLVLINAWDAASAAMVEHCGLPAIATSSAAVANAMGYADGQHLPWGQMLEVVGRIARAVRVPVTADIEAGFSADVKQLESSIAQIIAAGAVGVNLEDALPGHTDRGPLYPLAEQVSRIQAARRAAETLGIHLVINARVDAYWQSGVQPDEALRNTLERGKAYLEAGGDCVFVPGLRNPDHRNPDHIRTVVEHLRAPVNVLAGPGVPSIPELAKLGVKRVSYGSGPHRAAMGLLRRMADEAKTSGTYNALTTDAVPYAEINGLFGK